jgi:hypothetical protein
MSEGILVGGAGRGAHHASGGAATQGTGRGARHASGVAATQGMTAELGA